MPVDSKHPLYNVTAPDWTVISIVKAGEREVKAAGEALLPKLDGQTAAQYTSYKARGSFYNAYARTVSGLTGAAMRNEPDVEAPPEIEERMTDITGQGKSFTEVARIVVDEILTYGRFGILVDNPSSEGIEKPYFALYSADSIINWRTETRDSEEKLVMICLKEYAEKDKAGDEFMREIVNRIRVLDLSSDGVSAAVRVRLYEMDGKKWIQIPVDDTNKEVFLKVRGKNLDEIPFVFFGSTDNAATPGKPPLLDLANLNVKHWQVNVDYYHGLHYCGLPTPWAAGFPKDSKLYIGSKIAWISEDPEASCGYLEFTGQGLGAMTAALDKIERQMAVVGARFLEEQKKGVEAAEAIELRQTGDIATLSSVVTSAETGLSRALDFAARWMGQENADITVSMNRDFYSEKLDPTMLSALLQAVQAGEISRETFLHNLKQGEILAKDTTIDEEKERLNAENTGTKPFSGIGDLFKRGGFTSAATPDNLIKLPVK